MTRPRTCPKAPPKGVSLPKECPSQDEAASGPWLLLQLRSLKPGPQALSPV